MAGLSGKSIPAEPHLNYSKRSGTSGDSGHLYETKLLTLVLSRVLNRHEIEQFYLGTNCAGLGAFDDLVLKYKLQGKDKPYMLFVQAKHKENPEKEKVTIQEVQKSKGDFSMHKYFDSYLRIRKKFNPDSKDKDTFFKENFEEVDCTFVLFTSANENFIKKKEQDRYNTREDDLLHTQPSGITFQFGYEESDVKDLLKTASEWRIKLLAESLIKLIMTNKESSNISIVTMCNELIRTNHVCLAKEVFDLSQQKCKLSQNFFESKDNVLSILRNAMCEEILQHSKNKSNEKNFKIEEFVSRLENDPSANTVSELMGTVIKYNTTEHKLEFINKQMIGNNEELERRLSKINIELEVAKDAISIAGRQKLENLLFRLPSGFGNFDFEVQSEKRLKFLADKFLDLLKTAENNIVIVTDKDIGNAKTNILTNGACLKPKGGIAGLVGSLLILDKKTNMLKFNEEVESLPENCKILLEMIKKQISESNLKFDKLGCYMFDINVSGFPSLSLGNENYDKKLVKDFFGKLKFYTNQAKEEEVETILKERIDDLLKTVSTQQDFRIKADAIVVQVHNEIHSWWKNPKGSYLTKECEIFHQARHKFLHSPQLTILKFICVNELKKYSIIFNNDAIETLESKIKSGDNVIIETNEKTLSSIKAVQIFEKRKQSFLLIDFYKNYLQIKGDELGHAEEEMLVIVLNSHDNESSFKELHKILLAFNKKIIVITDRISAEKMCENEIKTFTVIVDDKHSFMDFDEKSQNRLLERKIIFQGIEVSLEKLLDKEYKAFIQANVISIILNNDSIKIGETFETPNYNNDVRDYFVSRSIRRRKMLKYPLKTPSPQNHTTGAEMALANLTQEIIKLDDFFVIDSSDPDGTGPKENQDIVIISDTEDDFKQLSVKYNDYNIHWFKKESEDFIVWNKSYRSLKKLINYVNSIEEKEIQNLSQQYQMIEPKTINDIEDKIVIISGVPGIGKSSLLSHLLTETKQLNPYMWIMKIDLRNHVQKFNSWQELKTKINEIDILTFLCVEFQKRNSNETPEKYYEDVAKIILSSDFGDIKPEMPGKDLLEIKLFIHFYNEGKLSFLFDGFDEICADYIKEVVFLLKTLKKSNKVRLWVTTRSYHNIQKELEENLETFSYSLEPLKESTQKELLEKIWRKKLEPEITKLENFRDHVSNFFDRISKHINDTKFAFTSLPQHVHMISKVFELKFQQMIGTNYLDPQLSAEPLNLTTLYEHFVNIKIRIRYKEKMPSETKNVIDLKNLIDDACQELIEKHKKMAAIVIFGSPKLKEWLSSEEVDEIHNLIRSIKKKEEKTGIIEGIVGNVPKFVHLTYAEYFAAEFIADKLKSTGFEKRWNLFVHAIILADNPGVRRFFDSKIELDRELARLCGVEASIVNTYEIFKSLNGKVIDLTNYYIFKSDHSTQDSAPL